jgi:GxxExxY protein
MTQKEEKAPRTHAIIGAAMEVRPTLGRGFLEAVYHKALALELKARGMPSKAEVELPILHKGRRLRTSYRADFVCFHAVVVELKAVDRLSGVEAAQVINYLKATGIGVGLLLNFGTKSLEYRRFVMSSSAKSASSADPSATAD